MPRRRFPSRKFSSRRKSAAFLVLAVALLLALRWWGPQGQVPAPDLLEPGVYQVERVVDGDTLKLTNGARVRLVGANTPETVKPNSPVEPWGPKATAMSKQFVAGGEVRLQFDGPPKDKYGRFLAYVWVGEQMLNEELIRAGLARAEPQYPYSAAMKARFRRAEAEARAARRGIWSDGSAAPGNL